MQINNISMKWYVLIGVGVIVVVVIIAFFVFSGEPELVPVVQTAPGLPVAGSVPQGTGTSGSSATGTLSFTTRSGVVVTVKDFIHNGETVTDVQNPGSYVLAGSLGYCLADGTCPRGAVTEEFSISYSEKTHLFNIVLLTEPLGEIRHKTEQFLVGRLGLTEQQLCSLDYTVGAPYWVNEAYDSKNLGFSFCPGATKLPL